MNIPNKEKFPQTREFTYLNTAAEGLLSTDCTDALAAYVRHKSSGSLGRPALYAMEQETVGLTADLLGTSPDSVTFLANATDGVNLLANSLEWREGDEVLITDLEFPSNVLPWLRLKDRGVNVRVVRSEAGLLRLDDFTGSTEQVNESGLGQPGQLQVGDADPFRQPTGRGGPPCGCNSLS